MIYDRMLVSLLSILSTEDDSSTNFQIARHVLEHADSAADMSVKALAAACHVGVGTVSRFAREAGFGSFAELREAIREAPSGFMRTEGDDAGVRRTTLARAVCDSVSQAAASVDAKALARLVADLGAYEEIGVYGLLKAQAAALDLQVDLLTLGKLADTCVSPADQARRIAEAGPEKLVIAFSYTGTYFDAVDVAECLRRRDRPRVWLVSGEARPCPPFVSDRLLFASNHERLGHPYQLEYVAGLIAQEYAATL